MRPLAASPLAFWKDATALRMFSPKPPSISPGENHARSRSTCARTTAAPRAPLETVAALEPSLIVVASSRAEALAPWAGAWRMVAAVASGAIAAKTVSATTTPPRRANVSRFTRASSIVELEGQVAQLQFVGRVAVRGPAMTPRLQLEDGQAVLVDLEKGWKSCAPILDFLSHGSLVPDGVSLLPNLAPPQGTHQRRALTFE